MNLFNVSNQNTTDYMSSFFGNLNSKNTSNSGLSSFLGDYYSVQNGTYLKVAKKYYSQAETKDKADLVKEEKNIELAKEASKDAFTSISKLMDEDLYKKIDVRDEDGNTKKDYNWDAITKNLNAYIEEYNDVIKTTGELDDTSVLKNGVRLVNQARVYEGALGKIGITIGEDNTLKLDEAKLKEANMTDISSLFTGGISYAKNMQTKFMQIHTSSNNALGASGIYNSSALTSVGVGSMMDDMF